MGWCDVYSPALKSQYVSKYQYIPSYSETSNWKDTLIDILEEEKYDLVIPCSDPTIIPLQLHRKELDNICKIYLLDDDCYKTANDKFKMQKLAKQLNINIPREIEVSKSTTTEQILSELPLPIVLKPQSSFEIHKLEKKKFVSKAFTVEDLQTQLDSLGQGEIVAAQENFVGRGVGVELLVKDGDILFAFQHLRIHEPLMGGGSSYRKSVSVHPELLEASRKIVKALRYSGVAMVEYKINLDTNEWVFIELNARFWGSLPLPVASGADFPYFLYSMIVDGKTEFNNEYRKGIYCRNISKDLGWLYHNLTADRSDPFLETRSLWKVALESFNLLFLRERYDTFAWDDLKPGFAEIGTIFDKLYAAISKRIGSRSIFRRLQKKNTLDLGMKVKSVLFVCKGNICRSPFAHYYLKSICPSGIEVTSCGYYPADGRPSPKEAIEAGQRLGIDIGSHRSTIINSEMVESADVIFTFDEENHRIITKHFSYAKSKIVRISSLDSKNPFVIQDPHGRDTDYFYNTYTQIKQLLDSLKLIQDTRK